MNQKSKIGIIVGIIAVIGIGIGSAYLINQNPEDTGIPPSSEDSQEVEEDPSWTNVSGPFAINKYEYKIGENVFFAVEGLGNQKGNVIFVKPDNLIHSSIPFDGTVKDSFKQYFKPSISRGLKICSIDDLMGRWLVIFNNTENLPITFEIINETVPGVEEEYKAVC